MKRSTCDGLPRPETSRFPLHGTAFPGDDFDINFHQDMPQPLRIVTYNIAHGRGLKPIQGLGSRRGMRAQIMKIGRLLRSLEPDVVAIQEIDEDSSWAGNFDQLEFLRRCAHFPYAVFGVNNRRNGLLRFNYGNAILSRHPIEDSENIVFGKKAIGEKGFLYAEIDVQGSRVPFVNMHLHHRSRARRLKQVGMVMDYLDRKHLERHTDWRVPPIVCGDLNNPSHKTDATASLFQYFLQHGRYMLYPVSGRTYPSLLPQRLLDFVFLPPGCAATSCRVVRSFLSDHRPVVVECRLK
ncbi:endonuclease/exonuclease/phosphatase family protein [Termitidicoccus mucosus]